MPVQRIEHFRKTKPPVSFPATEIAGADLPDELAAPKMIGRNPAFSGIVKAAGRSAALLPAIHIALVPTSGLLADMPALLTRINPQKSAYMAMITGPSRTADIERVLTIGVHGPERLVIVFVDELGGKS
jgi:hypothetical protein